MKKRSYELPMPNREYKDTIFRWIFSIIENLLSLYNAVTGKNYQNPEDLDIVTLENAIYMGMKNDLAFVLEMGLYLYEHQSTYNPNIPLRDLFYIASEYQDLVDEKSLYAQYVARVRKYAAELPLNEAVELAITECIREGILAEFLQHNRAEVYKVSIFEYDKEKEEKKLRKAERECGREEGLQEGLKEGLQQGRLEERKSLLALIAKMSAGGDADKITMLNDPEVMEAMQKKYGIK